MYLNINDTYTITGALNPKHIIALKMENDDRIVALTENNKFIVYYKPKDIENLKKMYSILRDELFGDNLLEKIKREKPEEFL